MKTIKNKKRFTKIVEKPSHESKCLNCYVVAVIAVAFVISVITFGFNTKFFVWFKGVKSIPTGQKGNIGLYGPIGYNVSHNGTVIESITSLSDEITDRIDTYDFCTNGTCSSNSIRAAQINTVIIDSGLESADFAAITRNLLLVEEITTNETLCTRVNCTEAYEFSLLYSTLVGNGTNNGSALSSETDELTLILTNGTFVKYPFSDDQIENGTLPLFELNGLSPRNVIITNSDGLLTKESKLAVSRGGLNYNSSSVTGFPFFTAGSLNYTTLLPYSILDITGKIKDSDLTTLTTFSGSKFYLGGANKVVIKNGTGYITTESQLASVRGGFATSSAAFNGYAYWNSGSIEYAANILRTVFTAGSPNHVIVNDGSGFLSSQAQLSTTLGGTGQDLTGQTGFLKVTNGVVSASGSTLIQYSELNLTGSLTNIHLSSLANLTRAKFAIGSPNQVIVNDANGLLSSESTLSITQGGIGVMSTAVDGALSVNTTNYITRQITIADVQSANLVDSSFVSNASLDRSKFAAGTANHVIINTAGGLLSSTNLLPLSKGGTAVDLTGQTGYLRKFNATVTTLSVLASIPYASLDLSLSLVDADFSASLALTRTKLASTSASHVIINDGSGVLSSEATLATSRGGLGLNAGSSSGNILFTSGAVTFYTYTSRTTYSPILSFGGATTGISQLITRGSYVVAFKLVCVEIFIILSSKGSAVGNAAVTLPVVVQTPANSLYRGATPFLAGSIDHPANYNSVNILPVSSASSAEFFFSGDNNAIVQVTDTHFGGSTSMQISFAYYTT